MKIGSFLLIFLFLFIVVPFVSAQFYGGWGNGFGIEQVLDSVAMNLEPVFRYLLGGYDWTGYLLFEKTLLFILFSMIVSLILQKIPVFESLKGKRILRLVAVIIGLLAVRNLNYIWVGTILVQYQVLFIAVAGILPFIIYWFFVKEFPDLVRKTAWVFYAVIYFGLWATTTLEAYTAVYLWGAVVALFYAFALDVPLQRWLKEHENKIKHRTNIDYQIALRRRDLEELEDMNRRQQIDSDAYKNLKKNYSKQIEDLVRQKSRS